MVASWFRCGGFVIRLWWLRDSVVVTLWFRCGGFVTSFSACDCNVNAVQVRASWTASLHCGIREILMTLSTLDSGVNENCISADTATEFEIVNYWAILMTSQMGNRHGNGNCTFFSALAIALWEAAIERWFSAKWLFAVDIAKKRWYRKRLHLIRLCTNLRCSS